MNLSLDFILPNWPAPLNVKALQTTRAGGVSVAPYESLNFGAHVQDNAFAVNYNRQQLSAYLPSEPVWLNQIHSTQVVDAAVSAGAVDADASFTIKEKVVCVVMTADCLPVLLCDEKGTTVAAIHAGWKGLLDGVIEAAVAALPASSQNLMAWLGPAIGPRAFEVGGEVRAAFIAKDVQATRAFKPHAGKWVADIYDLARLQLNALGISKIYGGDFCTYSDELRFFSYRRDKVTGRMATLIWLE